MANYLEWGKRLFVGPEKFFRWIQADNPAPHFLPMHIVFFYISHLLFIPAFALLKGFELSIGGVLLLAILGVPVLYATALPAILLTTGIIHLASMIGGGQGSFLETFRTVLYTGMVKYMYLMFIVAVWVCIIVLSYLFSFAVPQAWLAIPGGALFTMIVLGVAATIHSVCTLVVGMSVAHDVSRPLAGIILILALVLAIILASIFGIGGLIVYLI